jgi:hypothetical protein
MNHDVRELVGDAERAIREQRDADAYALFLEAGDTASNLGLWKSGLRCYRRAVELDLFDPRAIGRLARIAPRASAGNEWAEYATALAGRPPWPRFDLRNVQLRAGGVAATVTCGAVGTVLEVMMSADDVVEVHPDPRLATMPIAMALIVMRRAMWTAPRDSAPEPMSINVVFAGRPAMRLDEIGDWTPVVDAPRTESR